MQESAETILDAQFQTFGCTSAIATMVSSIGSARSSRCPQLSPRSASVDP
ncbi:MAG: iron-sulfur cluster assembly scaffold protein [Cyanobacteria bacterium J06614_10]